MTRSSSTFRTTARPWVQRTAATSSGGTTSMPASTSSSPRLFYGAASIAPPPPSIHECKLRWQINRAELTCMGEFDCIAGVHRRRRAAFAVVQGVRGQLRMHAHPGVVFFPAHHVHPRGHDLQAWRQQHAARHLHLFPAPDLRQVPLQVLSYRRLRRRFSWP